MSAWEAGLIAGGGVLIIVGALGLTLGFWVYSRHRTAPKIRHLSPAHDHRYEVTGGPIKPNAGDTDTLITVVCPDCGQKWSGLVEPLTFDPKPHWRIP